MAAPGDNYRERAWRLSGGGEAQRRESRAVPVEHAVRVATSGDGRSSLSSSSSARGHAGHVSERRGMQCVWIAILVVHHLVDAHRLSDNDGPVRSASTVPRRRQNDRMEPLSGGVAYHRGNFPTVYRRILKRMRDQEEYLRRSGASSGTSHAMFNAPWRRVSAAVSDAVTTAEDVEAISAAKLIPSPPNVADQTRRQRNKKIRRKIAKFLNLFTVVQFPNDACDAPAVGLTGTCYHHLQCRSLGGHPGGACARGYGVCCLFEKTCGEVTRYNSTYFVSPPGGADASDPTRQVPVDGYLNCFLTVEKLHPDVSQLRLDFMHFELAAPSNGSCLDERFVVISPDRNAPTPALCGVNSGQHMYVQVSTVGPSVRLGVQWRGVVGGSAATATATATATRRWVVRVTQFKARDDNAAPPGCLQYHTGHAGRVQSFGYLGPPPRPSYTNNLNYAVCIRKEAGFCSVTYSTTAANGTTMPFQLLNEDQDGSPTIPPGQAGAEVFNCPHDFIVVNGIRLCGERLNDAALDPDYTHDSPVTDVSSGPFVLPVRSNGNVTGRGFSLAFRQLACTDTRARPARR